MLTSDLNLSKNCKRIEILKCVLRTFIIIIIIIIIINQISKSLLIYVGFTQ